MRFNQPRTGARPPCAPGQGLGEHMGMARCGPAAASRGAFAVPRPCSASDLRQCCHHPASASSPSLAGLWEAWPAGHWAKARSVCVPQAWDDGQPQGSTVARDSPSLSPVDSLVSPGEPSSALQVQAPGGRSGWELGRQRVPAPGSVLGLFELTARCPRYRPDCPPGPGPPRTVPSTCCWGWCAGPDSTSRSDVVDVLLPRAAGGGWTVVLPVTNPVKPQKSGLW